ncbi:hypothetical protein ACTJNK_29740 [Achromobacter anxifer]|uniref:Uncharacterized protein n=1 Tax=Alcaligenes xylosoxydans xylosoxydans TaxID=85698 RepID=A0A424W6H6_ALCXX|nr:MULTISPECIES: hypothetical protein [Achromobacter]MBC9908318.1 hypothetical protein [Achromobacter xylosoxidans]MBD0872088.1 hypothetical protein [Achromobacter xylosoxidans]QNP87625.1 hypothetical protein IAG39_08995 [Achromobacter xylosoxidans]RPJ88831.1 hypothetical protein DY367_25865 [Achromobacter xylosoxidans]
MTFEVFNQYVVTIGAVIGALTGVLNLILLTRRKKDRFLVRCGSVMPDHGPETMVHFINKSDHSITVSDYGFITAQGKLHSIPADDDVSTGEESILGSGDLTLHKYNEITQRGIQFPERTLGAYAKLAGGARPQLAFHADTSLCDRVKVRSRLLVSPNYFLW